MTAFIYIIPSKMFAKSLRAFGVLQRSLATKMQRALVEVYVALNASGNISNQLLRIADARVFHRIVQVAVEVRSA